MGGTGERSAADLGGDGAVTVLVRRRGREIVDRERRQRRCQRRCRCGRISVWERNLVTEGVAVERTFSGGLTDAAYRAALEADQVGVFRIQICLSPLQEKKEEEEAPVRAAHETAEREAALVKMYQDKLLSLDPEPEKGPDITQVLVQFPSGERKERRFHCTTTLQSLHDYLNYSISSQVVSMFGTDDLKRSLCLQEELYRKVEELGDMYSVYLYLNIFLLGYVGILSEG
ncbi:hypothetical protein CQW23_16149 [Capsicum baccatum]|uniref:UBX domain-containing protein n=1 Tax=Capsicum baccatum TaxID=33114 RepID=A0A2G2WA69_CAPBA|nr:hypothetical protein CQW23_16149 [Capsicum baccatum]